MFKLIRKKNNYKLSFFQNPLPRYAKFEIIKELLSNLSGEKILDYGSGDSPYKEYLLTKFTKYISADYLPANLLYKKGRPKLIIDKEQRLDCNDNIFDCVMITEVLEHIYEPKKALKEINRVLKPGGKIVGSVPFLVGEHEMPYDYYRYTSFCLRNLLNDCGFKKIRIIKVGNKTTLFLINLYVPLDILNKMLIKLNLRIISLIINPILKLPLYLHYILFLKNKTNENSTTPMGFVFEAERT